MCREDNDSLTQRRDYPTRVRVSRFGISVKIVNS